MMPIKIISFKGQEIKITRGEDGLYRDPNGDVLAFEDPASMTDPISECGVAPFNLSPDSPLTPACAAHDIKYNTPVYQENHSRKEADKKLEQDLDTLSKGRWYHKIVPGLFYGIVRIFGGKFWENDKTNQ